MVKKVVKTSELKPLADAFRRRYLRDWDGSPIKLIFVDGYNEFFEEQGYLDCSSNLLSRHRNQLQIKLNAFEDKYEDESEIAFHIRRWRHGESVEVVSKLEARTGRVLYVGRKLKKRLFNERRAIRQIEKRALTEGVTDNDYDRIKGSRKALDTYEEVVGAHSNALTRATDDMYHGYAEEVRTSISRREEEEDNHRRSHRPVQRYQGPRRDGPGYH